MEIRIINRNDEIINISNMAIITTMDKWIVGINERGESVRIEEYENKEEAKDRLIALGTAVEQGVKLELKDQIIRT